MAQSTTTLSIRTRGDLQTTTRHYMDTREESKRKCVRGSLNLTVLGMYSGPTLGSVDCTLLRYQQRSPEEPLHMTVLQYEALPIPLKVRLPIVSLLHDHVTNPQTLLDIHRMVGQMFSTAVDYFCNTHNIASTSINLIGAHVTAVPPLTPSFPAETNLARRSWGSIVTAVTGITTATCPQMTRRRLSEQVTCRHGSLDQLLLQHPTKFRVSLTITDTVSMSIVPPVRATAPHVARSIDCGPGTMFIDYAIRYATSNQLEHDHDGSYGAQGSVNNSVVNRFLETHDYTNRPPPLHIASEMFGHHEAQGLIDECLFLGMNDFDTTATITRITAENIARQYRRLVSGTLPPDQKVDELFISGPGARNTVIVDYLEAVLPEEVITRPLDDIGIPGDAKDSMCAAQMGFEAVLGMAATDLERKESAATLCNTPSGSVSRGKLWEAIREQVLLFSKGAPLGPIQQLIIEKTGNGHRKEQTTVGNTASL